jgi:hypothetical protein
MIIERFILCHHFADVEVIFHPLPSGEAQLPAARGIGDEGVDRFCQGFGIGRGDEESGGAGLDDFRIAADLGRDDGKAARHRFEQGKGNSLGIYTTEAQRGLRPQPKKDE